MAGNKCQSIPGVSFLFFILSFDSITGLSAWVFRPVIALVKITKPNQTCENWRLYLNFDDEDFEQSMQTEATHWSLLIYLKNALCSLLPHRLSLLCFEREVSLRGPRLNSWSSAGGTVLEGRALRKRNSSGGNGSLWETWRFYSLALLPVFSLLDGCLMIASPAMLACWDGLRPAN